MTAHVTHLEARNTVVAHRACKRGIYCDMEGGLTMYLSQPKQDASLPGEHACVYPAKHMFFVTFTHVDILAPDIKNTFHVVLGYAF